jgi:2-polyprenyl-3-methyl-5-hydroxy-6-metoxy-1,4-benzoquinol methylase
MYFSEADELVSNLKPDTLEAIYKMWGEGDELDRFLINSYVNRPLIEYIQSRSIPIECKNVLEFGCRDGSSFMAFLFLKAGNVTGMDIDESAMEVSGKIYADLGYSNIEYRANKVGEPLPCEDEEFDIVSCNAVLEHIRPELRRNYLRELQRKVKKGGYLIISDTPNRLWLKDGHTTGIWFLNYLPFKLQCRLGSLTKRYKSESIRHDDYDFWIAQGIQGVSYKDIYEVLDRNEWSNDHDLKFKMEFKKQTFDDVKTKRFPTNMKKYISLAFASSFNLLVLKRQHLPSLAISPSLMCSFRKR